MNNSNIPKYKPKIGRQAGSTVQNFRKRYKLYVKENENWNYKGDYSKYQEIADFLDCPIIQIQKFMKNRKASIDYIKIDKF